MSKDYVTLGVQRESLINNPLLQKVTTTLHVLPLFFSYNRQELSGVIWGGGGVQQLASDKMVEILVQASNGQYPNKTSQFFYSDMLIISLRMFKEGGGGGGGWGRCNSDLSLKCVSWEFPVMQIVSFFLDTWAIFLCDHLHHPNHFCFLDNWDNTSNHMESSLKHNLCSV